MMAGRLETNLEEELKKELVKPEFMSKPDSEWTEEEQKAAKEFEKKQLKVSFLISEIYSIEHTLMETFLRNLHMNSCSILLGLQRQVSP